VADEPTFYDHLEELRRRLFWILGFLVVASVLAFFFNVVIIALTVNIIAGLG